MIGRGIATRIALAALVAAGAGLLILVIGVTVVGAGVFRTVMVEAGASAAAAQAMYDESVTTVVLAAVLVAAVVSIVLAIAMGRMLAQPMTAFTNQVQVSVIILAGCSARCIHVFASG